METLTSMSCIIKDILNDIDWESAEVEITQPSDYRFIFQFKNPKIEAKEYLEEVLI